MAGVPVDSRVISWATSEQTLTAHGPSLELLEKQSPDLIAQFIGKPSCVLRASS
jgi:hypothetical protein